MASLPPEQEQLSLVTTVSQNYARYCPAVMRRLTQALLAALKFLAGESSLIQRNLTTWYIRFIAARNEPAKPHVKSLKLFAEEVETLLGEVLDIESLAQLSAGLQKQFKNALETNMSCMLPSYNHQLPQGTERGTYLALDVGGSTFRVAMIGLSGPQGDESGLKILSLKAYKIDDPIKQLVGVAFFDWMAGKIEETIFEHSKHFEMDGVLPMGLAWSFPIEQTSLRSGWMMGMGKGFLAAQGLLRQDLGEVIQQACSRRNLSVKLDAIVNDSSATLLSKAYTDNSTRYGLILGTGVNVAVHLPVHVFQAEKFGIRPPSWHSEAKHVIVNTELSMFGKGLLPMTPWDDTLNTSHILPDFQPFEYLVSGRYLGEIARLIILDGVHVANLFDGYLPPSLQKPYSLDTEVLAHIEGATTQAARTIFTAAHPSPHPPSDADMRTLRLLISDISKRSSALVAAAIHALWQLRLDSSSLPPTSPRPNGTQNHNAHTTTNDPTTLNSASSKHNAVACNGSVIEKYPYFRHNCQNFLDALLQLSGAAPGEILLEVANESSLRGAAVAVAVAVVDREGK